MRDTKNRLAKLIDDNITNNKQPLLHDIPEFCYNLSLKDIKTPIKIVISNENLINYSEQTSEQKLQFEEAFIKYIKENISMLYLTQAAPSQPAQSTVLWHFPA
ncbi:MAG: hypothetical protein HGA96_11125 [Desulfobulbaceae bacterium]|nr:hypothetical protein [Desulfobulbaceae bacterium]